MKNLRILSLVISLFLPLITAVPAIADGVVLHPGHLTGTVSITGQKLTYINVYAIDANKVFSANTSVGAIAPEGDDSITYNLIVEGNNDYYVMVEASVAAPDQTTAILPLGGPVNVPVYVNPGDEAVLNRTMDPAVVSGTISTTTDGGYTIDYATVYASLYVPEFDRSFYNTTYSYSSTPGVPGKDYKLLVAPGLNYYMYAYVTISGIQYSPYDNITAPAAGETLDKDFAIDVSAATISGTAKLLGADVTYAYIYGNSYSPPPSKWANTTIGDISSGAYTLDVTAGSWSVYPQFSFNLTGNLAGQSGSLRPPSLQVADIGNGANISGIDFIINPGFITGKLGLTGPKTDFSYGNINAYSSDGGYAGSPIDPASGDYMFVVSPGGWLPYYLSLSFYYPPDGNLYSYIYQYDYNTANQRTVASGETVSGVNLAYETITVKLLYTVEGGGILSSPYYQASRTGDVYARAYASGSSEETTEGQVIGTLLLPGKYDIDAFASVGGSNTEFGTFSVTVEGGDVVVIGGTKRPMIKITNPFDREVILTPCVTVEGTASDDVGIASITIDGNEVTFTSTGNPDDPHEVKFSHEVCLSVIGENTITIVAKDLDESEPVTLTLTVIREAPKVEFEIPGQCVGYGHTFSTFDADTYVSKGTAPFEWTWSGNTQLMVNKNAENVFTITYPDGWTGTETITFKVTDAVGGTGEGSATFTVNPSPVVANIPDQTAPFVSFDLDSYLVAPVPAGVKWSYSGNTCLQVTIDENNVVTVTSPGNTCTGAETITFTATATVCGEEVSSSDTVTFSPGSSLDCSGAYAVPAMLWPPNHNMIPVHIFGVKGSDDGHNGCGKGSKWWFPWRKKSQVKITITGITSDEPTGSNKGCGGKKHAPDATGVGTDTAYLRAECEEKGNGRVYQISFTAVDNNGAECSGSVKVEVPSSNCWWKHKAVDDGQIYDATKIN